MDKHKSGEKPFIHPAVPVPFVLTLEGHIQRLKDSMNRTDPVTVMSRQNIAKVIELYETGELKLGEEVLVQNGQVVTQEEVDKQNPRKGSAMYEKAEAPYNMRAMKCAYPNHSLNNSQTHMIYAQVRLLTMEGADGTAIFVSYLNDTGSDNYTALPYDFQFLGDLSNWIPQTRSVLVTIGTGQTLVFSQFRVEIRLMRIDWIPWSEWFVENAVILDSSPGVMRLSGALMRKNFFIGTDPTYANLAIADPIGGT